MGNDPICVVQNRMAGNNVLKDLQLALRRLKMSWAAAVEHMPRYQEIVGSNPTRCWAFFSSSIYSYWSVLNLKEVHLLLVYCVL